MYVLFGITLFKDSAESEDDDVEDDNIINDTFLSVMDAIDEFALDKEEEEEEEEKEEEDEDGSSSSIVSASNGCIVINIFSSS